MNSTGYALMECDGMTIRLIKKDIIKAKAKETHSKRLRRQYEVLKAIKEEYEEEELVVVKEALHGGRITTAIILAKVHGIADFVFDDIIKYAPTTIKKQITGNGKANKEEVATAVIERLAEHGIVDVTFKTDDESDAVAVALTYYEDIVR